MNFISGILNGLGEIWSHKLRSLLTMVCILLGVSSVVITVGFVEGLFTNWVQWLAEAGGLEKISIFPNPAPENQQHLTGRSTGLSQQDALAIRAGSRYPEAISPEIDVKDSRLQKGGTSYRVRVQAVTPAIFDINRLEVEKGRTLSDLDVRRCTNVIVIGSTVAQKLFKESEEPLGTIIRVNGLPCEIVGVLRKYAVKNKEAAGDHDPYEGKNNVAFIPLTTAKKKLLEEQPLTFLNVRVANIDALERPVGELTNIMRFAHRGVQDYKVRTMEENFSRLDTMKSNFTIVGMSIGAVTLIVGGIGIMNLMLASINERVREIGVRKALGAWNEDLFVQFMAEAIALSLVGGTAGVLCGAGLIQAAHYIPAFTTPPELSISAIIAGFVISVFTGIFAGIYPALLASRLDPIEALRFE